jgi:hypothetical protein
MNQRASSFLLVLTLAVASLLLGAGCATKVDWNSRIGVYTHDQAVAEMGPPDKSAKLTDGSMVAEWLSYRSGGYSQVHAVGGYPYRRRGYYYSPTYVVNTDPGYDHFLRLTFDAEGRLTAWKKVTK